MRHDGLDPDAGMLDLPAPGQGLRAIIAVPVHDEESTIDSCLAALAGQIGMPGRALDPASYEIILLLNNCTDDTRGAIEEWRRSAQARGESSVPVHVVERHLPAGLAHVGEARRQAMDLAWARFARLGRSSGIIATTDADTLVAPDWLAATEAEIRAGADAVGGQLRLRDDEALRAVPKSLRRLASRHRRYERAADALAAIVDPDPHDPWPRHKDHGAASLAVTAQAYAQAGGLPPLPSGEDQAFHRALLRADLRFRHSPLVQVRTSFRLDGRVTGGMASTLSQWNAQLEREEPILVEAPHDLMRRLAHRRRARKLWHARSVGARDPGRPGGGEGELREGLETAPSCAAFLDSVALPVGAESGFIPLDEALSAFGACATA